MELFFCEICNKNFKTFANLRKHTKNLHPNVSIPSKKIKRVEIKCPCCRKIFGTQHGYRGHMRKAHPDHPILNQLIFKCAKCLRVYQHESSLIRHLKKDNCSTRVSSESKIQLTYQKVQLNYQTLHFSSLNDFNEWKMSIEDSTNSRFILRHGDKKFPIYTKRTYYCYRSGYYKQPCNRKRSLKVTGSRKINSICPCRIVIKMFLTGHLEVKYQKTHSGHDNGLEHLFLRKDKRKIIAAKLAAGMPFEIIKSQLKTESSEDFSLYFAARKDIENIRKEYGLDKNYLYKQNHMESVASWIKLIRSEESTKTLVRYSKFKDQPCPLQLLPLDEFMLILADEEILQIFRNSNSSFHLLSINSTFPSDVEDFQLTAISSVDKMGRIIPLCFCFSSKIYFVTMTTFFKVFLSALGFSIEKAVLVTDIQEVIYNAWVEVMGEPLERVFSFWHLERIWKGKLIKTKGGSTLKNSILKNLRNLLQKKNKEKFQIEMENLLKLFFSNQDSKEFGSFFLENFASCPEKWAWSCYRNIEFNLNYQLEAMHSVIKYIQLRGKKNRRMDRGVESIVQMINSKKDDQKFRKVKGKNNYLLVGISRRHKQSKDLIGYSIHQLDSISFSIQSNNDFGHVVIKNQNCENSGCCCELKCIDCFVCIHGYVCNCLDSCMRRTICKHIHFLVDNIKLNLEREKNDRIINIYENKNQELEKVEESKKKQTHLNSSNGFQNQNTILNSTSTPLSSAESSNLPSFFSQTQVTLLPVEENLTQVVMETSNSQNSELYEVKVLCEDLISRVSSNKINTTNVINTLRHILAGNPSSSLSPSPTSQSNSSNFTLAPPDSTPFSLSSPNKIFIIKQNNNNFHTTNQFNILNKNYENKLRDCGDGGKTNVLYEHNYSW